MRMLNYAVPSLLLATLTSPCHAATVEVDIHNLQFAPAKINAKVGDTVRWTNRDTIPHTATVDGVFDVIIPAKTSGSITLKSTGSFDYRCRFHSNMKGHIEIAKL